MKNVYFDQWRVKWTNRHKIILDTRLFKICKIKEAVILSFLIERYFENNGEPFEAGSAEMFSYTGVKVSCEKRSLSFFEENGYIRLSRTKTTPSKRLVEVFIENIEGNILKEEEKRRAETIRLKNLQKATQPNLSRVVGSTPITLLFHNKVNKKQSIISKPSVSENSNEFISTKNEKDTSHKNKNKVRHQDVDLARAEALAKGLSRRNKIAVAYSTKRWANEFAKLRNIDKIENEKISFVLDWYIPNIGEKYMPVAYSAKTFREKFSRLAELAEKTKPIPISPEVASLSRELEQFRSWPKNSKKDVEVSCQVCFDSYQEFFRKLSECKTKINRQNLPNTKKHYRVAVRETIDYLWKSTPSASAFTREWMSRVSDRISKWDKWNGDLRAWAWNGNFNSPDFLKFFIPYLQNYSTSGLRYWNTIKELM